MINNSDSPTVPDFIDANTGEVVDGLGTGGVTAVTSKENYKRTGEYDPDKIYYDNTNRKDTVFYEGLEYIVNKSAGNTPNNSGTNRRNRKTKQISIPTSQSF